MPHYSALAPVDFGMVHNTPINDHNRKTRDKVVQTPKVITCILNNVRNNKYEFCIVSCESAEVYFITLDCSLMTA